MSAKRWLARHLLVVLACLAYVLFAHPALFALPLAALLVATSLRTPQEWITATLAGGLSLTWLLDTGDLPDQLVRAGAVVATGVFVTTTRLTRAPVIHRALFAVFIAAFATGVLLLVLGSSWGEARWWVEYRVGYMTRMASQLFWLLGDGSSANPNRVEQAVNSIVRLQADYFPALDALRILAGLALAAAVYQRVALEPYGAGLARFSSFRFNEHLGWAAIAALLVVLIPSLAAAELGATNLLIVLGALYALRGVAVAAFGLQLVGASGCLFIAFAAVAAIFILPLVLAGAILLGVVDSGMDLRRRWTTPPTD
ncbi:MAG: DUF2232 domain-containing protein [Gemmatimonadota bacterium]|nr:MAG: DUF2232 domain-containing protein [Gemmatimonadota bacterium]